MSASDRAEPDEVHSLGLQSWLFPSCFVSLGDSGPNQPLHSHHQNTSNFGFPAPHLLPRSASAGVPVFALSSLPSFPQTPHRHTSVSTLQSVARDSSGDLQFCKSADRSTWVGPPHAHHRGASPTNSCPHSAPSSTPRRSVGYRTSSLERSSSRASSHLQAQYHPDPVRAVYTAASTPTKSTPRSPSHLPSRSVSDTNLRFVAGESFQTLHRPGSISKPVLCRQTCPHFLMQHR